MFSNIFENDQGDEKRRRRFCLHSAADVLEKNMQRGISAAGWILKSHEIPSEITTFIRKLKKTQCFSILFECHSDTNWAVMGKPVSPGLWKGMKTVCFSCLFNRKCIKPKLFTTFRMASSRQLPPAREAHIPACRLLSWPLSLHALGASFFACVSLRTYGKQKWEFGAGSPKWPYKT